MDNTKKCGKCGEVKPIEMFRIMTEKRISRVANPITYPCSMCRACEAAMARARHHKNREHNIARNKEYKQKHSDELKVKRQAYLRNNAEHVRERYKKYCENNREKLCKIAADYRNNNIGQHLRAVFRSRLAEKLKKVKPTGEYIGTKMSIVKKWIEWNMLDDMTWENWGSLWQIDHTLPINLFDMEDDMNVFICFNWKNLMPLYASYNRKKSDKIVPIRILHQERQLRAFKKKLQINEDIDDYIEAYSIFYQQFLTKDTRHFQIAGNSSELILPQLLGNLQLEPS